MLRGMVDVEFDTWQDPALMRHTDEPIIFGDSAKFMKETGWRQEIPLEVTLKDMLAYWREVL
jgi:GDP-4-dehydro-6-deoxy-D-mannose reductase